MEELNYSVKPMMDSFNLEDFLRNRGDKEKYSAYMIITKKQLVCGFTNNNGSGHHRNSLANALREIYDLPSFKTINEISLMEDKIENSFITGRFINDVEVGTYLAFYLQKIKCISLEEFTLFEHFYNKYNSIIEAYSIRCGTPLVFVSLPNDKRIKDEYGNEVNLVNSDNLDCIYNYLKTIISKERELLEDKKIIGVSLDEIKRR